MPIRVELQLMCLLLLLLLRLRLLRTGVRQKWVKLQVDLKAGFLSLTQLKLG